MKWNIEWVDLQSIERMIAECWRMNEQQLQRYYKELSRQQELIFAGKLGITFLELMYELVNGMADYSWSDLQKDVHMIQKLIQDGLDQDDFFWHRQYQELADQPEFYFYTRLGQAFTGQLAIKLELDITAAQKMLRRDIQRIQEICETCDWENDAEAAKALAFLKKQQHKIFSSWLGDGFVHEVQERFGEKEEPAEPEPQPNPVPEQKSRKIFHKNRRWDAGNQEARKPRFTSKRMWMLLICISMGFMGYWLQTQIERNQGIWKMRQLTSAAKTEIDDKSDKAKENAVQTAADRKAEGNAAGFAAENTAAGQPETAGALDQDVADTGIESGQEQEEAQPEVLPQYQAFYEEYPDLFGWLKIPDTEIDHPVMQSDDETSEERYFYLHHDFAGNKTEEGSLFVDSKSSRYPQDNNTVIYGHNMKNGHNFGMLEQFANQDFCKAHQTIQFDTIYETGTYQVAAVLKSRILYQEEEGFRYYQFFNYDTESDFQECVDFIKENQLFDMGKTLQYGDQLLMMSTCEYSQENGRLAVVAKKVG